MPASPFVSGQLHSPAIADPTEPLYYLENAHTLIDWVFQCHPDLLSPDEVERIEAFRLLSQPCQALLIRLVMRTHDEFRHSDLVYPELTQPIPEIVTELADGSWLEINPTVSFSTISRLLRKHELVVSFEAEIAQLGLSGKSTKTTLVDGLEEYYGDQLKPANQWWPRGNDEILSFNEAELFRRLRLMFFGNLRQDWSQFVVTALGYQRYEIVPLDIDSRAFQSRRDVDLYLQLFDCRESLEDDIDLGDLYRQIPSIDHPNPWLEQRRNRLLFSLGHLAERQGKLSLAITAYRASWNSDSRIRYFRVQEKQAPQQPLLDELELELANARSESELESLGRIKKRLSRKISLAVKCDGQAYPTSTTATAAVKNLPIETTELVLEKDDTLSVERAASLALSSRDAQCFYVENLLFNGLLGLLCWPAIYSPVPGAFFNPFQAGPADLYRESFVESRSEALTSCLETLNDHDYKSRIIETWRAKNGITNSLVNWSVLNEDLLAMALHCISPQHLKAVFQRQLSDLASFRKGLPDLVRFWPDQQRYELIEIKAPGDRLQDHQRRWFHFFNTQGIPARLCQVTWAGEANADL